MNSSDTVALDTVDAWRRAHWTRRVSVSRWTHETLAEEWRIRANDGRVGFVAEGRGLTREAAFAALAAKLLAAAAVAA
jgi:hypothetical protein